MLPYSFHWCSVVGGSLLTKRTQKCLAAAMCYYPVCVRGKEKVSEIYLSVKRCLKNHMWNESIHWSHESRKVFAAVLLTFFKLNF